MSTERQSSRIADLEHRLKSLEIQLRVLARQSGGGGVRRGEWKGVLDEDLDYEGTATVSLWHHDGEELVDTGVDVEAHDWFLKSGEVASSGLRVIVKKHQDGKWWVTAAQCED